MSGNSETPGWTLHRAAGGAELIDYTWRVPFESQFDTTPHVLVRLTHLRLDRDDPETRVGLRYENFTPEGFDITLKAPAHSHLWEAEVEWAAVEVLDGCEAHEQENSRAELREPG